MQRLPLKNNLYLTCSDGGDYLCFGYYISKNSCEIVVKRFDVDNGWGLLYVVIDENETIEIPMSNVSNVKYSLTTKTELYPIDLNYQQKIPKVIVQTHEVEDYKDINHEIAVSSVLELNPEYEHKFFNDIQRREFIKNNFDNSVLKAYDTLVPGAYKADLFRYCYLYQFGGCYFDYKIIAREPLRNIIKKEDELLICIDYDRQNSMERSADVKGYLNSVIMCTSNNKIMLNLIHSCVDNILNKQDLFHYFISTRGCMDILLLTGPTLMYNVFKGYTLDKNLRFKHIILNNDETFYKNFQIVDIDTGKHLFTKTFKTNLNVDNHYSKLWEKKELFYKNRNEVGNLIIYVYPHPYHDTFKFKINNEYIYTERTDSTDNWWVNLNIKLIDNTTSLTECLNVGRNYRNRLNKIRPVLPSNVYFSTTIKDTDIFIDKDSTIISIGPQLLNQVEYIKDKIPKSIIILCLTDEKDTLNIETISTVVDYVILYTESLCNYYCKEKNLKEVYTSLHISSLICSKLFKSFKYFYDEFNFDLIEYKNIHKYISHCKRFLKPSIKDTKEFCIFSKNYNNINVIDLYNLQLLKYYYILTNLNNIITESGEKLEGNIFYSHDTYGKYEPLVEFKHKRYNLFYYSRQAYNILEIGFNGGHSTLLYLISNQSSKIQLFDLGEHSYSRKCFEYLNKEFPNRLSIVWGDSTKTVEQFKSDIKYDFIHIDGGHTKFIAESDFYNCKELADKDSLVLIDDTQTEPLLSLFDDMINYKIAQKVDLEYQTDYHMLVKYII